MTRRAEWERAIHDPAAPSAPCPYVEHTRCDEPGKCAVMGCITRTLAARAFGRDDRRAALVASAIKGSTTPTKHWAHDAVATLTREVLAVLEKETDA